MKIIDRKFLDVPTPTCHASTIAFHDGEPVFAWFGGRREGLPDSSIYVQYRGKVISLGTRAKLAYWNPILFKFEDELFLAYKRGEFCDRWQTYIRNITDFENVESLSECKYQIIPAGLNFAVKTKPMIIDEVGFIYCGSSVETREDWASYIEAYRYVNNEFTFVYRSEPLTVPKEVYEYESQFYGRIRARTLGIIQPSLWMDDKKHLHAFFRSSRGLGKIYYARETGEWGESPPKWTQPAPLSFSNPNSGIDTVCIGDRQFLVYNPSSIDRFPLVIAELKDINETIDELVVQEKVEGDTYTPELSYPYMIEHEGKLHLVYTYGRTKIEYVVIEI
jgi:alpha-L-rhamnosidase